PSFDLCNRRRIPFTSQRIVFRSIETHGQVECSFGSGQPVRFLARARTFVLEVEIKRAVGVVLEWHPATDGEAIERVRYLKALRVIECNGPKRADWRQLAFVEVKHILVRAGERLASLVAEIERINRVLGQVRTEALLRD